MTAPRSSTSSGGFPDGARTTPVPDVFFSRDLPELADPVAVKLALHFLWRIHRRPPGTPPALRVSDLMVDTTLRRGIVALGVAAERVSEALQEGLSVLLARRLLLGVQVASAGGPETWLLLNDKGGRAARRRLQEDGLLLPQPPPAVPGADTQERPTIFQLYEDNIGLLTPLVAEELEEASVAFPAAWIEDAFRLAVAHNARNWAYVRAILDRWAREGRGNEADRRGDKATRERDSEGPYAAYIER